MYVQEITKKRGTKKYRSVLIRESFREGKLVRNRTVANISKLPDQHIKKIKEFLKDENADSKPSSKSFDQIQVFESKEYGASKALLSIARELELDKMIYSRKNQWRENALAMIVGRLTYQGSKLSLTNMYADTDLWRLCGHSSNTKPDVNKHCYQTLDRLLDRQESIQEKLSEKYLEDDCVVLYDITSSYFEGEYVDSELVTFGYNRDGKRGHEQVNIGLLTNAEGCPVAVETFAGNTTDQVTVQNQARKIIERFKVKNVVFVGDRGMLTPKRIAEVNSEGFKTITALTHAQMQNLLDKGIITESSFSANSFPEVSDPDNPGIRYVLCLNLKRKKRETKTRYALIEKTKSLLHKIKTSKKKRKEKDIGAAVGKIWSRYKTEKFFIWSIEDGKLDFSVKQSVVDRERLLDGCYVIRGDVAEDLMSSKDIVKTYKKLIHVEQAFRVIKTTLIEIRPVYHHLDDRIRSHVFLCMLAYYLQWNINQRLGNIFKSDGKGKNRRWTVSQVIERLKGIRTQSIQISDVILDEVISTPDKEQQLLIDALGVSM